MRGASGAVLLQGVTSWSLDLRGRARKPPGAVRLSLHHLRSSGASRLSISIVRPGLGYAMVPVRASVVASACGVEIQVLSSFKCS